MGETLQEATVREGKEETGYDIKVGNIISLNEAFIDKKHVFFITFHAHIIKRPEEISQEETIIKKWMSLVESDCLMPVHLGVILKQLYESGAKYPFQKE